MFKTLLRFLSVSVLLAVIHSQTKAQSPGGVSGSRLWLKSNTGVTTSGGVVSAWADQSGNGNHATQATAARQPGYTASSVYFNGNPSLNFDITDDGMATAASIPGTAYSFL